MRSSPNARRTGGRTRRWQRCGAIRSAPYRPVGRASLPNPCPNPLAILEAGVRGLSTWVSPLVKATPRRRFPHGVSARWTSPRYLSFVIYYAPLFWAHFAAQARF